MYRINPLLLASLFVGLCTASSYAQTVTRQAPPLQSLSSQRSLTAGADYIVFHTVDNHIDCETLGDPFLTGDYTSKEGMIEVDSSVDIQVSYANGTNLKSGPFTIPTTFELAVRGLAVVDGTNTTSPSADTYTAFGALPSRNANESGTIIFPANAPYTSKGLKARIVAKRQGLNDHAGIYSTQIVLSWARL